MNHFKESRNQGSRNQGRIGIIKISDELVCEENGKRLRKNHD